MGTKQLTKGNCREKFLRMEKATIRASESVATRWVLSFGSKPWIPLMFSIVLHKKEIWTFSF